MIGKRDDRRKDDAVKKAEMELKKKKEEAVREVCVASFSRQLRMISSSLD